jgi:mono/diheme cytochrome c family protein
MAIAALAACIVINVMPDLDRERRTQLINRAAHFLAPMLLMPFLGAWYFSEIPSLNRTWAMGGSAAMTLFLTLSVGASLLIGAYAIAGLLRQKLYINGATASLLLALAFCATAGGEFVREGIRKPYTVQRTLFSNSLTQRDVEQLRQVGSVTADPYPLRDAARYPNDQVRLGAKVFRFQCSICHTIDGANGLLDLTRSWTVDQKRMNFAQLQRTKPFMPPFAGNAHELEALVQMVSWIDAKEPPEWPTSHDPRTLEQINAWLEEAGTKPAGAPPVMAQPRDQSITEGAE